MVASARVFLSRRNLLTLLNKLDAKKRGEQTACQIIKSDTSHPQFPLALYGSGPLVSAYVSAVEDEEYYTDRQPGEVKVF